MHIESIPVNRPTASELIATAAPIDMTDQEELLRRIFDEHGQHSGEAKLLRQLLDENVAGVAIFTEAGERLFSNHPYLRLDLPSGLEMREDCRTSATGVVTFPQDLVSSVSVKLVELDGGFSIITDPAMNRLGVREKAFGYLVDTNLADEDILRRAALALGRASGWRWIGVSRFRDDEREIMDFPGWWDAAELKPEFESVVKGSPHEVVVTTEEFCYYDGQPELRRRFPTWTAIDEYPVMSFAGLTYDVDGKAAGHIVAMHDEAGTSRDVVEDLLRLFSQFIGVHIGLEHQRDATRAAQAAALTDQLTGLGNHLGLERHLDTAAKTFRAGDVDDVLVVLAEVDDLDTVNEDHGTEAGDRYLKSYAEVIRKMWRPTDHFFRVAGGRYAMVIAGINPGQIKLVQKRLMDGAEDLKKAVSFEGVATDVSYGISFASAHGGDMAAALQIAESEMAEMRVSHRAQHIARAHVVHRGRLR